MYACMYVSKYVYSHVFTRYLSMVCMLHKVYTHTTLSLLTRIHMHLQALAIKESTLGPNHLDMASTLSNLGVCAGIYVCVCVYIYIYVYNMYILT